MLKRKKLITGVMLLTLSGLTLNSFFTPYETLNRDPSSDDEEQDLSLLTPQEGHAYSTKYLKNANLFIDGEGMSVGIGFFDLWMKIKNVPLLSSKLKRTFEDRAGIIFDEHKIPIGVENTNYKDLHLSTIQCSACHFGKAYGQIIPGLGNKTIDMIGFVELARKFRPILKAQFITHSKEDKAIFAETEKKVDYFFERLTQPKVVNETKGLIPVGIVRSSFYPDPFQLPDDYSKSQVKVPHLWGYGEKRHYGSFYDGFGDASIGAWAASIPYVAGQRAETILKPSYQNKLKRIEDVLAYIQPPKYPLPIDTEAANRGHVVFERSCTKCHQSYEQTPLGFPIFKTPLPINLDVVKTDDDVFNGTTPYFKERVNASPLASMMKFSEAYLANPPTYLSPRLEGVWSRFPYLHNGSVPTLDDLLRKDPRPKVFNLYRAGEVDGFDPVRVGLIRTPRDAAEIEDLSKRAQEGERALYWTERKGHSNRGHPFYIKDDQNRKDLIEYLKTL